MNLFEKEEFSSKSKMTVIEISDVIEDIKFSSLESEHSKKIIEDGYLSFIRIQDDFGGNLCYYIKPTQEVKDHMINVGYGDTTGVGYSDISNTISFHSLWESTRVSITTTPQIAGVLNKEKLQKKMSEVPYEGDCQVSKAYSQMYACEPNYALTYINITGQKLEKMKALNRNIWLAAGFMLKDDEITKNAHNGDYDLAFNDPEKMKFLNDNFVFEKPFYIPESPADRVRSKKTRKLK
jgi:hypothetical protein